MHRTMEKYECMVLLDLVLEQGLKHGIMAWRYGIAWDSSMGKYHYIESLHSKMGMGMRLYCERSSAWLAALK
jgi:hypothetical protein